MRKYRSTENWRRVETEALNRVQREQERKEKDRVSVAAGRSSSKIPDLLQVQKGVTHES